ncbi:MAG: hypothetical protein L6R42_005069 [Xanthoria sp. 1 TBL-2021]|nr:MAG: hypothetical protein L6R42_005069 [Xanthoria sp. 1 TBL-2021]
MPKSISNLAVPTSQKNLRLPQPQAEVRDIYILVMGLTGAGKSTFISVVTGDDTIPIGAEGDMDSGKLFRADLTALTKAFSAVTYTVTDYILDIRQGGVIYRVHLIDSPGFDDGTVEDVKVLTRIANFINFQYKFGSTLAGVLYLHDIMKGRMGGVGQRNLRMLEKMIGIDKWDNCTLVTTKWGCTTNPEAEAAREATLKRQDNYFGSMLKNSHQASIRRFEPKSKGQALDIIKPHLKRSFEALISEQMVKDGGPKLSLGETSAGQIVASHLQELKKMQGEKEELEEAHQLLGRKFDEEIFANFKSRRDKLLRAQQLHKIGRWAARTTLVGGAITATVVTLGPGAAAFALGPAFEGFATRQKNYDQAKMDDLQKEFEKASQTPLKHASEFDAAWLRDPRVKSISDLSDNYSLRSSSSTDLSTIETVTGVATEFAHFSIKDSILV